MARQVVSTSVCYSNYLNPAIGCQKLCIDTVLGVVCFGVVSRDMEKNLIRSLTHFIFHVLTVANFVRVKTELDQKELYTSDKVPNCLIIYFTLLDCFAKGNNCNLAFTCELNVAVKEIDFDIGNFMKAMVLLSTSRINII